MSQTGTDGDQRDGAGTAVPTKSTTMGSADVLIGLVDRAAAGDGPDRDLDAEIDRLFNPLTPANARYVASLTGRDYPEPYTTSLDAALAFAERALPGQRIMLWQDVSDDDWGAHFRSPDTNSAYAASPARAVVAATLQALIDALEPA